MLIKNKISQEKKNLLIGKNMLKKLIKELFKKDKMKIKNKKINII